MRYLLIVSALSFCLFSVFYHFSTKPQPLNISQTQMDRKIQRTGNSTFHSLNETENEIDSNKKLKKVLDKIKAKRNRRKRKRNREHKINQLRKERVKQARERKKKLCRDRLRRLRTRNPYHIPKERCDD